MLGTILYIVCIVVCGVVLDRFIIINKYGKLLSFVLANLLMWVLSMGVFVLNYSMSGDAWDKQMEAALWLVVFSVVFFIGSAVYSATAKTNLVEPGEGAARPKSSNKVLYFLIGIYLLIQLPFLLIMWISNSAQ
jgi:hypothetical protein